MAELLEEQNDDDSIDDQVKAAERDKYLAEAKKATSEHLKAEFERKLLEKEEDKKWYRKKEFRYNISKWAVGIGFVLAFINYVVVPIEHKENIELGTENATTKELLRKRELKLDSSYQQLNKKEIKIKEESNAITEITSKLKIQQKRYNKIDSQYVVLEKSYSTVTKSYGKVLANQLTTIRKELNDAHKSSSDISSYLGKIGGGYDFPPLPGRSSGMSTGILDTISTYKIEILFKYKGQPVHIQDVYILQSSRYNKNQEPIKNTSNLTYTVLLLPGGYQIGITDNLYKLVGDGRIIISESNSHQKPVASTIPIEFAVDLIK